MKLFFAIVQAIILGGGSWIIFNSQVNEYKEIATAEPIALAQKYFDDTSKNLIDANGQKKYATVDEALMDAERDIGIGKKVQSTSGMKLGIKRVLMTVALSCLGFIGWFIAFFIVSITTYPLQDVLDSIWGNFVRYFLVPTAVVSSLGGGVAIIWAEYMMQTL